MKQQPAKKQGERDQQHSVLLLSLKTWHQTKLWNFVDYKINRNTITLSLRANPPFSHRDFLLEHIQNSSLDKGHNYFPLLSLEISAEYCLFDITLTNTLWEFKENEATLKETLSFKPMKIARWSCMPPEKQGWREKCTRTKHIHGSCIRTEIIGR